MNNPTLARWLAGLGIVGVGVISLLDSLNIINFDSSVWSLLWPCLLIAAGVIMFVANRSSYLWSGILVVVGVAFLVRELGYSDFNVFSLFWPLVLIAVGVSFLVQTKRKPFEQTSGTDNYFALLSGSAGRNSSKDYKGGKATAILGGVELDLRGAEIKKEAVLEIFTLMGGVEIRVPKEWDVTSEVISILGGVENKASDTTAKNAPKLTIVGNAMLGGVEVKN